MNEGIVTCKGVYMYAHAHTHTPYSTVHTHFIPHNAKWATGSDKQMSKWGDPSAGVCCCSLTPPALSLSGLVSRCPLAIRDRHLTGLPITHTHHTSCATVCVSVSVCMCVACLPAVAQLCLNAAAECQSSRVVPVTHTAGWRHCVGAVSTLSVMVAAACLCIPRPQKHAEASPRPAPALPHQPARPSVLLSASVCLHVAVSLYPHSARLWSTFSYQPRSASLQPARKGGLLSRSVVSDALKYTDWTPRQLIGICLRDSLLQVWLRSSLLRDVKAFAPCWCGQCWWDSWGVSVAKVTVLFPGLQWSY